MEKDKDSTEIKKNNLLSDFENTKEVLIEITEQKDYTGEKTNDSNELSEENNGKKKGKINIKNIQKMMLLFKTIRSINIVKNDNKPISIIDNKIYIGSMGAAQNKQGLKDAGITHVLCAAATIKALFPEDFKYLKLENLLDSPNANIKQHFNETNNFIHECISTEGVVMVHCFAGISRSSTIIIAYMIKYLDYDFEQALEFCQSKREKINPNQGFRKQIDEYEKELKGDKLSNLNMNDECNNLEVEKKVENKVEDKVIYKK
jgi:protein-tyrosine phosphatase